MYLVRSWKKRKVVDYDLPKENVEKAMKFVKKALEDPNITRVEIIRFTKDIPEKSKKKYSPPKPPVPVEEKTEKKKETFRF
ncbi:MAG: hypothetical protein MUP55_01490 [Candidatus Aenigmarchaeota archaeon]|nr:hypothetical protein [Candidatus Aenigmarchaeota archaeon]